MKTIKNILEWIYAICLIVCPLSFIMAFVGLLILNAEVIVYSFLTYAVTLPYVVFYGTHNNPRFNT